MVAFVLHDGNRLHYALVNLNLLLSYLLLNVFLETIGQPNLYARQRVLPNSFTWKIIAFPWHKMCPLPMVPPETCEQLPNNLGSNANHAFCITISCYFCTLLFNFDDFLDIIKCFRIVWISIGIRRVFYQRYTIGLLFTPKRLSHWCNGQHMQPPPLRKILTTFTCDVKYSLSTRWSSM